MKVQIIYSSLTGCTKKVANAIFNGIDVKQKTIHDLKDGTPVLDGDIILLGYWGILGSPNDEMKEFMQTVKGKAVGIFCTLGYYADSAHARQTVETGLHFVKEHNEIIGTFVGNTRGHCPLCGPGIPEQCDSDENREPDHEQPPERSQDRQKQKCAGHRRLRFR